MKEDYLKNLKEFSQGLIGLGQLIEESLLRKQSLEDEIKKREAEIRKIQNDIFALKSELTKVGMDLVNLEARREEIGKKKDKNA
ncbi:MAG: hypothetical protein V1756_02455 [Patescibacteria group bacterium]